MNKKSLVDKIVKDCKIEIMKCPNCQSTEVITNFRSALVATGGYAFYNRCTECLYMWRLPNE
jgi:DNA-directed RNA polymerase subunit M/transcription elongation factor TFIIS